MKKLLSIILLLAMFACTQPAPEDIPPPVEEEDSTKLSDLSTKDDQFLAPADREAARAEVLSQGRGFYKDVFMDGGIRLTSRTTLPATNYLGISLEYFASAENSEVTKTDTLIQHKIFTGSEEDTNGWLLYPDGSPRYRMIYVNGGSAASHLKSMEMSSRENLCKFVEAGGGYIGTCAGAFIASSGILYSSGKVDYAETYLGLWPGYVYNTGLNQDRTNLRFKDDSPLLRYYSFGNPQELYNLRHNGGCSAKDEDLPSIPNAEALSHYVRPDKANIDGRINAWSYKANERSGRVISCGSHPEGITSGKQLNYMAAMILYAMDGNPVPQPKGELKANEVREMNKRTEDNNPAYTRIGDGQYHHFTIEVPSDCNRATVTLEGYAGEDNFELVLCGKSGELAYIDNTDHKTDATGCNAQLVINEPTSGKWYVSVFCETTVESAIGQYGTEYTGRTDVLNGVPYKIAVKFE